MSALGVRIAGTVGGALALDVGPLELRGVTALVGPNGAGKSTLLRFLLGALRPSEGWIRLDEVALFDASTGVDVPVEARRLGYVPQHPVLFPHLDVAGNVAFGLRGRRELRRQTARVLLAELGLGALGGRRPDGLSGGEQQKVALARALAPGPRALLLDEPLAALDVDARVEVRAWLAAQLRRSALPTLLVTHDAEDVASVADRVIALDRGRVVADGPLAEVRARPPTPFLRALFGSPAIS